VLIPVAPFDLFSPLCDFVCLSVLCLLVIVIIVINIEPTHIYVQATGFDGVFLLVAFHCIALICNYCFLIVINKISIYLSIYLSIDLSGTLLVVIYTVGRRSRSCVQ